MTPVEIRHHFTEFGRCAPFWRHAVGLGLLRAIKLNPVTVYREEWQAFADSLDVDTIRKVNATFAPKKKKEPSSTASRPGRKPGSSIHVQELREDQEPADHGSGSGGTRSGQPSRAAG